VSYNENVLEKTLWINNSPKKEFQLCLFGRPCKLQPQKMFLFLFFATWHLKITYWLQRLFCQTKKSLKFNDLPISCMKKDLIGTSHEISLPIERIGYQQTSVWDSEISSIQNSSGNECWFRKDNFRFYISQKLSLGQFPTGIFLSPFPGMKKCLLKSSSF
jgi:hypothetical protein